MAEELGLQIQAVPTADEAVAGADVVSLCTDSVTPIFPNNDWIEPGMHITAVLPSEFGKGYERADVVILHERGGEVGQAASSEEVTMSADVAARMPSAHLLQHRTDLPTLADLLAGQTPGRTAPDQVTYYHNIPGSGIQFAAVGARLYQLAREHGVGQEIPTGWFLQDIRD
jgi:ornithine cyclodeaminase/alanine dehydrogenase-like protein (mu-crystallin family)